MDVPSPGGLAFAAVLALATLASSAAGFDCARATTAVEKSVCANPELSALDEHLDRYYAAARTVLKEGASCLQADQQEWLRRRNRCADAACLKGAYLDRLSELDGLQPGATAIRETELPRRPVLAWIIPPAADKVAAPPNPRAMPAEISGNLLDEVATGDGFVLRSASGERHLLLMLMFIDGPTAIQMPLLAREKQSSFVVRGHVTAREGRRDFEPSRCIFIHRAVAAPEGRVFADPAQPHSGFKPHQLAFATPKDGIARTEFRSVPFYAVILRTAERCSITEAERLRAQALFPRHKVFASRFGCENEIEEHITYTNVDPKWGFMAVYAGSSAADGEALLKTGEAGRFPGANVRRMQAVLVYP